MRGSVLSFDPNRGEGIILADDGNRRPFTEQYWSDKASRPVAGLTVDFVTDGESARDIFAIRQAPASAPPQAPRGPAASPSTSDGSLLGGLSLGAAVLGLLPGFGVLFLIAGFVLGIMARRQAKIAGNSTGLMLGAIGIALSSIVVVVELIFVVFLGAVLFASSTGSP
ncbi:MAG: hypothetical protein WDN01_19520 [Rhizomicrobium sp.]